MDAIILAHFSRKCAFKSQPYSYSDDHNRDGDTRIRLYYNLSNDHFIRSYRHGAILIPVS